MGFFITGSITDGLGNSHENYYARIDTYRIDKSLGYLNCTIGSYVDKTEAAKMFPEYQEDYLISDASGYIPTPVTTGSYSWGAGPTIFNLSQSALVTEIVYSSSFQDQLVDYIDYDDDGNEITVQRTESVEVLTSESVNVSKSRIDLNLITGSVYDYAYLQVRNYFIDIYGSDNVQDDI